VVERGDAQRQLNLGQKWGRRESHDVVLGCPTSHAENAASGSGLRMGGTVPWGTARRRVTSHFGVSHF